MTVAGELWVAPVGAPPWPSEEWTMVGAATGARLADADAGGGRAFDLGPRTLTVSVPMRPGALRNLLRVLGWRRGWGPPPLAPGCLPASTVTRKRGGRRA